MLYEVSSIIGSVERLFSLNIWTSGGQDDAVSTKLGAE
jgi:hypothetical protein